jgi:uncharacterized protein
MKIIIADTGPLIALAKTDNLFILKRLFEKTVIPKAVCDELLLDSDRDGVKNLRNAIFTEKWLEIYKGQLSPERRILNVLDSGEPEAITLAVKLEEILLIDERLGRVAAQQEKVKIIGTAGLLLLAKRKNLIPNVKDTIVTMQNLGYRFSKKLLKLVFDAANE